MINIKVGKTDYTLKFTYNSFKHMSNLKIADMTGLEENPFKMIDVLEKLFIGALNHDKNVLFLPDTATEILYEHLDAEDVNIGELFAQLTNELTDSKFFRALQNK